MASEEGRFERPERRRLPRTALVAAAMIVAAVAIGLVARPDTGSPGEIAVEEDGSRGSSEEDGPTPSPEPPLSPDDGPDVDDPEPEGPDADDPEPEDAETGIEEATGSWSELAEAPLSPRHAAPVWTGQEVVVWGGRRGPFERPFFEDGAAYDPASDSWRELAPAPLGPRDGHVAVHAEGEVLIWGGENRIRLHDDGAAYDLEEDSWTTIPPGPLSPRRDAVARWVGGELVVAGGTDNGGLLTDVAAYDPENRSWRTVSDDMPLGMGTPGAHATVLDGRLVVWSPGDPGSGQRPTFRSYDPEADAWDEIEPPPALAAGGSGLRWVTATEGALVVGSGGGPGGGLSRLALHDGDTWDHVAMPSSPRRESVDAPVPHVPAAVAGAERVYVFDEPAEPLRYDTTDGSWAALPAVESAPGIDAPGFPQYWQPVPTDDHLVVWLGGMDETDTLGADNRPGVVVWRPEG